MNIKIQPIIGVMDSGMGGLSILRLLAEEIPALKYIYYGDLLNSPYGSKTTLEVRNLTEEIIEFFLSKQASAILVACNTATSASIEYLRKKYTIPIYGMEPAIKPAILSTNAKERIGVLATSLTLKEEKYFKLKKSLDAEDRILPICCDGLASLIDQGNKEKIKSYVQTITTELAQNQIHTIVLGCTHYLLIKDYFLDNLPSLKIFDGNLGTVNHIKKQFTDWTDSKKENQIGIYLNGGTKKDFELAFSYLSHLSPRT